MIEGNPNLIPGKISMCILYEYEYVIRTSRIKDYCFSVVGPVGRQPKGPALMRRSCKQHAVKHGNCAPRAVRF